MSEQEQLTAKDQARKETQPADTMNALREQQQLAYENETGSC